MVKAIRVSVIVAEPLFRAGAIRILSSLQDVEIAGEGETGQDALWSGVTSSSDVIILAIEDSEVKPTIGQIVEHYRDLKIITITDHCDISYARDLFLKGARGCLSRNASCEELIQSVLTVGKGELFLSQALSAALFLMPHPAPAQTGRMTYREEKILTFVGRGLTNKEIGRKLNLQEKTVKGHITKILEKLQVSNRVQAAVVAAQISSRSVAQQDGKLF